MSATNVHRSPAAGFTLVELLLALSLSGLVFAGIFSSYLFIGRSFTRLVNVQQQESQSRLTLQHFVQDLSAASALTAATTSRISLTKPSGGGSAAVTYAYSAADGTFTRIDETGSRTLLSGVTALTLSYFSESGGAVSDTLSVKSVELMLSTTAGNASIGTRANYTTASSRVVLRNKAPLQ